MDEMEMGDLDRPEDRQEEQQGKEEEETSFGEKDRRNESMPIIDVSNPNANVRKNQDAMKKADRNLGKGIGVRNLKYTLEKKKLLREMGINVEKKDGPSSSAVLEKLSLMTNKKVSSLESLMEKNSCSKRESVGFLEGPKTGFKGQSLKSS